MRFEHKLSNVGWKYGYIMWRKRHDQRFEELFGGRKRKRYTALVFGHLLTDRRPDWRRRRVAITMRISRSLPRNATLVLDNGTGVADLEVKLASQ
ncbi:MAG: hypothetical protein ABSD47_11195 [Candidatus Methylomirabilota bacterium]